MGDIFEILWGIFVIYVVLVGINWIWRIFIGLLGGGASAAKAAVKSAKDGTSFKENFKEESYNLGPLECKMDEITVPLDDGKSIKALQVQIRGLLNTTDLTHDLQAVISFRDITKEDDPLPILSALNELQEPLSRTMMIRVPLGEIQSQHGFLKWVNLQRTFPDFMIGPKKGKRKIRAILRVIPNKEDAAEEINFGLHSEELLLAAFCAFEFSATLKETGYQEAQENFVKIRAAFVEFGVLMAFADGELDDSEGLTIKKWIAHQIDIESDKEKQTKLKVLLNKTLKEAYAKAKTGKLSVTEQIKSFKKVTTQAHSLALLEFLFEIVGADGEIASSELKVVNSIADKLDVSTEDVKSLTDKTFLDAGNEMQEGDSAENILGITEDMPEADIKKLLNGEFKKWNGRIQALEDGDEKDKAQIMLNVIAEARKKYG